MPMADGLELLPKSYAELRPKLGPPLPGDLGAAYLAKAESIETPPVITAVAPKPRKANLASYSPPSQPKRQKPAEPVYTAPPETIDSSSLFFKVGNRGTGA